MKNLVVSDLLEEIFSKCVEAVNTVSKEETVKIGKLLMSLEMAISKLGKPLLTRSLTEKEKAVVIFMILQDQELRKSDGNNIKKRQLECIRKILYTHLEMSIPDAISAISGGIALVEDLRLFVFDQQKNNEIEIISVNIVEDCSDCGRTDCPDRK